MWLYCDQLFFLDSHARATRGTWYIYTCTLHRFTYFKCKPLCGVIVDTVLVTIKRGLNDSYTDKIIFLIESVNLSLVRANVNHLHNDSCLTCRNQKCWFGVVIESPWFINPHSESIWAFKGYSRVTNMVWFLLKYEKNTYNFIINLFI